METSERRRVVRGTHARWHSAQLALGLGDASRSTFDALGWALGDARRRRAIKRLLRRVGAPVRLAEAPEGWVRVEGRVEVVEPVSMPGGDRVGLYRAHDVHDEPCGCQDRCTAVVRVVRAVRDAGRFLVRDESGVAVVEPGAIVLRDYLGNALDPWSEGRLVVRHGDSVTIAGEARRRSAGELSGVVLSGFREARLPLVFEGTREAPTYVFAPTTSSSS